MSLQNSQEPRFDAATQTAILNLAARLDSEHRDSASVGELTAVAEEAGIDPQFVQEALLRISLAKQDAKSEHAPDAALRGAAWAVAVVWIVFAFVGALQESGTAATWVNSGVLLFGLVALAMIGAATKKVVSAYVAAFALVLFGSFAWVLGEHTPAQFLDPLYLGLTLLLSAAGGAIGSAAHSIAKFLKIGRR